MTGDKAALPPVLVCTGGYEVLADETGNWAQVAHIALRRMADRQDPEGRARLMAILHDVLHWLHGLHDRLVLCPNPCDQCAHAAVFLERINEGNPKEKETKR